jgi:hypothetical protein
LRARSEGQTFIAGFFVVPANAGTHNPQISSAVILGAAIAANPESGTTISSEVGRGTELATHLASVPLQRRVQP